MGGGGLYIGGGRLIYGRHLLQVVIFIAPVNYTVDKKYGVWLLQKYGVCFIHWCAPPFPNTLCCHLVFNYLDQGKCFVIPRLILMFFPGKGKSMGQLCPSGHKVYCLPGRSYKELYHLYVPLGSYLKVQNSSKQNRIAYKARIYCTIFLIKACLHTQS